MLIAVVVMVVGVNFNGLNPGSRESNSQPGTSQEQSGSERSSPDESAAIVPSPEPASSMQLTATFSRFAFQNTPVGGEFTTVIEIQGVAENTGRQTLTGPIMIVDAYAKSGALLGQTLVIPAGQSSPRMATGAKAPFSDALVLQNNTIPVGRIKIYANDFHVVCRFTTPPEFAIACH